MPVPVPNIRFAASAATRIARPATGGIQSRGLRRMIATANTFGSQMLAVRYRTGTG